VTGLVSPFGFDAVQWKICVVTGWKMSRVMLVTVRTGFTPVQFGFGQPAVAPGTVAGVVKVAGFVVNVRFPFVTGRLVDGSLGDFLPECTPKLGSPHRAVVDEWRQSGRRVDHASRTCLGVATQAVRPVSRSRGTGTLPTGDRRGPLVAWW
jgi:hypothetical protein